VEAIAASLSSRFIGDFLLIRIFLSQLRQDDREIGIQFPTTAEIILLSTLSSGVHRNFYPPCVHNSFPEPNLQQHTWNPTILSGCTLFIDVRPAVLCVFLYHYQPFTIFTYATLFTHPVISRLVPYYFDKNIAATRHFFTFKQTIRRDMYCTSSTKLLTR
jgi:hypothetical protein